MNRSSFTSINHTSSSFLSRRIIYHTCSLVLLLSRFLLWSLDSVLASHAFTLDKLLLLTPLVVQNDRTDKVGRYPGGPLPVQHPAQSRVSQQVAQGCVQFWVPPKTETPQPLWETCSSVWPGIFFSPLRLNGISCISVWAHLLLAHVWELPRRAWLHLQLPTQVFIQMKKILLSPVQAEQSQLPALPCSSHAPSSSAFSWLFFGLTPVCQCPSHTGEPMTGPGTPAVVSSALRRISPSTQCSPEGLVASCAARADWCAFNHYCAHSFSSSQELVPRAREISGVARNTVNPILWISNIPYDMDLRCFNTIVKIM